MARPVDSAIFKAGTVENVPTGQGCEEREGLHHYMENNVDFQNTNNWLRSGNKGETEGLLIAAQDQALYTRNYQKHIVGNEIDSRCRMCYKESETIDHIRM